MPRSRFRRPPALLARLALAGAAAVALGAPPALAQANTCQDFGKTLNERKDIVQRIGALGGKNKKVDAKTACAMFSTLVANGASAVKWLEANKDWCQVPDPFVENIKSDHARSVEMRTNACKAAAQQAAMEKKAKEAASGGGSGLLGGGGLTGSYRMPQGAL
jgi:hypothetical protein